MEFIDVIKDVEIERYTVLSRLVQSDFRGPFMEEKETCSARVREEGSTYET